MVPFSRLKDTSKYLRLRKEPIFRGILPEKELLYKNNESAFKTERNGQIKKKNVEASNNSHLLKLDRVVIESGIDPSNLLSDNQNSRSLVNLEILLGIVPTKLLSLARNR
jgi:hypothetical protein